MAQAVWAKRDEMTFGQAQAVWAEQTNQKAVDNG
jgi:hypothetical protein